MDVRFDLPRCRPSDEPGQAKKAVRGEQLRQELQSPGIVVRAGSMSGLVDEAVAYGDVAVMVDVVPRAEIGRKLARLEPIVVIKG